jgi:hypothetical protein
MVSLANGGEPTAWAVEENRVVWTAQFGGARIVEQLAEANAVDVAR